METRHQNFVTGIFFITTTVLLSACSSGGSSDSGDTNNSLSTRSWGTAELINTGSTGTAEYPQIATNAVGNVIAVWTQKFGTADNVWARHYNAESGWEQPVLIGGYNIARGEYPQIAINNTGNAFALWAQDDGTTDNIWANRYTTENGWDTAEMIEPESGSASNPEIAIDTSGNAYALWGEYTNDNRLYSNIYRVENPLSALDTGWGTEQLFHAGTGTPAHLKIAKNTNGGLFAVWVEADGDEYNTWARTSTYSALTGTSWSTAEIIDNASTTSSYPAIAHDGNGNAVAIWEQNSSIYANHYTAGIGWNVAELIEDSDTPSYSPQIAVNTNGNAIAIWSLLDGTLSANRYTSESGWGTAEMVETADDGRANGPQVAIDTDNSAMAVWTKQDGTGGENIWTKQYTPENGWGTAEMIQTLTGNRSGSPKIAIDGFGDITVVWKQSADGQIDIWANRFE